MKLSPENQVVDKTLEEIKVHVGGLDSVNTNKLASDLWDLELKISALRSFIVKHLSRETIVV